MWPSWRSTPGLTGLSRKHRVKVGAGSGWGPKNRPQLIQIHCPYEQGGGAVPQEDGTGDYVGGDRDHRGRTVCPGDSADTAGGKDHPV